MTRYPPLGRGHLSRERWENFVLDPVRVEDRFVVAVVGDVLQPLGHERFDEAAEAVVLRAVVDDELVHLVGEQVARGLQDDVELAHEHGRRLRALALLRDLAPESDEISDVLFELLLRQPLRHGAHDEAARGRFHGVDRLPEARPLFVAADALADPDVLERRQVDDVPTGQRDVARAARALRPDGLLGDLDDDLLALFDDVPYRRGLRQASGRPARPRPVVVATSLFRWPLTPAVPSLLAPSSAATPSSATSPPAAAPVAPSVETRRGRTRHRHRRTRIAHREAWKVRIVEQIVQWLELGAGVRVVDERLRRYVFEQS